MKIDLSGKKIRLLNTVADDIDQIISFEIQNNQFVHSYSKEEHLKLLNDSNCLHLSLRSIENNTLVGHLILFGTMGKGRVLEFRRIAIAEKGNGYGREAIVLLKKLCFELLKFHRLWLDVYDDNSRAIQLYESEGFVKEGVLRDHIKAENGYRSQRIYSMLENEYKGQIKNVQNE